MEQKKEWGVKMYRRNFITGAAVAVVAPTLLLHEPKPTLGHVVFIEDKNCIEAICHGDGDHAKPLQILVDKAVRTGKYFILNNQALYLGSTLFIPDNLRGSISYNCIRVPPNGSWNH
jgi:hypothetical protein